MAKPPIRVTTTWAGERRFDADVRGVPVTIDGDSTAGPSPVEALGLALATCMGVDVADIVRKGRHDLRGLSVELVAERAPEPPSRFTSVALRFRLTGEVPDAAVERAIALSHDKYCSVWHTCRQDLPLTTSFEVVP
ncbi:MAG: OsmC family protein [Vicinamibacterales bacterium]